MPREPIELVPIPGQPASWWGPGQEPGGFGSTHAAVVAEPSGVALLAVMVLALFVVRRRVRMGRRMTPAFPRPTGASAKRACGCAWMWRSTSW